MGETTQHAAGESGSMSEEVREVPAFACCSVGIGRWFWVAWESEAEARELAKPLASGYEKSASLAEKKAEDRLGTEVRRLPAKWASNYARGGTPTKARSKDREGGPKSRFGRRAGRPEPQGAKPRLAFLYSAAARVPPDSLGHVTVTRHRIVKQTAAKIYVESQPFDEEEWARRSEESPDPAMKPHTLAVDRAALRKDGRYQTGRTHGNKLFYASEDAGIRDAESELTAKHAWCAVLGLRIPCSLDDVKTAYRRLAFESHPDRGGDDAVFRPVERAYRAALAYFSKSDDSLPAVIRKTGP